MNRGARTRGAESGALLEATDFKDFKRSWTSNEAGRMDGWAGGAGVVGGTVAESTALLAATDLDFKTLAAVIRIH